MLVSKAGALLAKDASTSVRTGDALKTSGPEGNAVRRYGSAATTFGKAAVGARLGSASGAVGAKDATLSDPGAGDENVPGRVSAICGGTVSVVAQATRAAARHPIKAANRKNRRPRRQRATGCSSLRGDRKASAMAARNSASSSVGSSEAGAANDAGADLGTAVFVTRRGANVRFCKGNDGRSAGARSGSKLRRDFFTRAGLTALFVGRFGVTFAGVSRTFILTTDGVCSPAGPASFAGVGVSSTFARSARASSNLS